MLTVVGVAAAFADEVADPSLSQPSAQDYAGLLNDPSVGTLGPSTDPGAAEQLPHGNLDRGEALELLQAVFGEQIAGSAGLADEVEVLKYYSNHVALVAPDQAPVPGEEGPQRDLLESFLPLRTEDSTGQQAPVDLSLEHTEGELQPSNPLVEVGIPSELGDGIVLPETQISIELAGAPADRSPSTAAESTAFFPNVATDTDLTVAPTPIGVETLTQLRSPNAPHVQTFNLTLPDGAQLESIDGGAQIVRGQEMIAKIPPPTAIDAAGDPVAVSLEASGDSIVIEASPTQQSSFPILVDPLIESYHWTDLTNGYNDWYTASNSPNYFGSTMGIWGGQYGLNLKSTAGTASLGAQANWNYYVPRYFSDYENPLVHERPSSYIDAMNLTGVYWWIEEAVPYATYPIVAAGLWDEHKLTWANVSTRTGNEGPMSNAVTPLPNINHVADVKNAGIALLGGDTTSRPRHLWVPQAEIQLTDNDFPNFAEGFGPSKWVNETAEPITFVVGDNGLGVYSMLAKAPSVTGGINQTEVTKGCTGAASSPCPRTWSGSIATYNPKIMAQGEDTVELVARDPVAHFSDQASPSQAKLVKVKVDHTKPTLAPLSGTVTEQGTLGTWKPTYSVKYSAADGGEAPAEALSSFGGEGTAPGKTESPTGVAVEANGNVLVLDRANKRVMRFDKNGVFLSQFGTPGTADGQINDPMNIAVSAAGNIWIAEMANARVQEFNASGQFIRKITCACFSQPYAVAAGPNEAIWVSDIGTDKLFKYREDGVQLLVAHGNQANPAGAGTDMTNVTGIAIDASGGVWAAEYIMNKIFHFDANGNFVSQFGTYGTGDGQVANPAFVAVAPSGNLMVVDYNNNRLQEFKPNGTFMRKFGSLGSGVGQMNAPQEPAFGTDGVLYVPDYLNHRVNRWAHADLDPQSGVASAEVKVDGVQIDKFAPGCATRNCTIGRETTLDTNKFAAGQHTLEVIATDGVGLTTASAPIKFESHPDKAAPSLALSGTMTEQATLGMTRPNYVLKAAATDPGGAEERKSGVASETIKVDGTVVKASSPGCPAEGCSLTQEWTLESSKYSAASYAVEVIATDGAGLTSTKTLTINIAKDTSPPTFSTPNAFYNAPEGWLEQKSYLYNATALDSGGYGLASLVLKIDGAAVKAVSQTCPAGSCSEALGAGIQINMATYKGGEHPAELIATDGAGNVAKKVWTINVDPKGVIGASEAVDTVEAVEVTAPEITEWTPVGGVVSKKDGDSEPIVVAEGGQIVTEGAPVESTIGTAPGAGFGMETDGVSEEEVEHAQGLEIKPTKTEAGASLPTISEESAVVISNTSKAVDTVLRPAYDGIMAFQAIRDGTAPESYSWEVTLHEGESLKLIDEQHAGVFWDDGTEAMLISAQPAHGADGEAVTTTLAVSEGNIVTETIHYKKPGIVYPVVAGIGWEGGFHTEYSYFEEPEDPAEASTLIGYQSAPLPVEAGDSDGASVSGAGPKLIKTFKWDLCNVKGWLFDWDTCEAYDEHMRGFFYYNYTEAWYPPSREPKCHNNAAPTFAVEHEEPCEWAGANHQLFYSGAWLSQEGAVTLPESMRTHITAQDRFYIARNLGGVVKRWYTPFSMAAKGDGTMFAWKGDNICNPWVKQCATHVYSYG